MLPSLIPPGFSIALYDLKGCCFWKGHTFSIFQARKFPFNTSIFDLSTPYVLRICHVYCIRILFIGFGMYWRLWFPRMRENKSVMAWQFPFEKGVQIKGSLWLSWHFFSRQMTFFRILMTLKNSQVCRKFGNLGQNGADDPGGFLSGYHVEDVQSWCVIRGRFIK